MCIYILCIIPLSPELLTELWFCSGDESHPKISTTSKQPWWKHVCVEFFCSETRFQWMKTKGGGGKFLGVFFPRPMVMSAWLCKIGFYEFLQQKLWLGQIWPSRYVWARSGLVILLVLIHCTGKKVCCLICIQLICQWVGIISCNHCLDVFVRLS
jgi:hypothetical protein